MLEKDQISVTHAECSGCPSTVNSDDEKDTITAKIGDVRRRTRELQQ